MKPYTCNTCGAEVQKCFRCVRPKQSKFMCPNCGPLWGDDKVVSE